ncbi:MAG: GTP 3',8-cyclase MoaA [Anaerolineae bacterium]|nr:GTP 3',8-cyclase MoaA [Anaerolineales bacterium]MCQ3973106.1 GTP 3',8-cyclase MoaA [Anaerolineae bacterium]
MKDGFGREINYLRLSLTDRCNLRCVYCMPMQGLTFVPGAELLTAEELEKVVCAAVDVGFNKVRLTGGEPTLRQDVVDIVRRLARIEGVDQLVMTTNGYRLPYIAQDLAAAGLKRVNIHVDSLNKDGLAKIMRLGSFDKAWAGIEAAEKAGLTPIKLNAVITRDYNDSAAVELARLTLEKSWQIRFIELMPFAGPTEIQLENYVSSDEVKSWIEAELGPLFPINEGKLDGEARVYRLAGSLGTIGFISPVSNPYCDDCNRMRLTADGRLRMCLLTEGELDFRQTLRSGGNHRDLVALFERAIQAKPVGHSLRSGLFAENRTMSQIGG